MNTSLRAVPSPDEDEFFLRLRSDDRMTEALREGQRALKQARTVQAQWQAACSRMARVRRDIEEDGWSSWESAAEIRLQQEERAHGLSKQTLERELARGRRLEDEVLAIQDQERERLARELHDGVCQNLASLTFLLEVHLRHLSGLEPGSPALRSGQQVNEVLSATLQEIRSLSHGLSGVETGDWGENLGPALHALAERLNATGGVRCTTVCPGAPALGREHATHIYRIVQEAVANAMRHGRAQHVEIRFEPVDGQWQLTITDDGIGVPDAPTGGGLGMRSMQYRVTVLGGTLEVRRARAAGERPGTVVRCVFP